MLSRRIKCRQHSPAQLFDYIKAADSEWKFETQKFGFNCTGRRERERLKLHIATFCIFFHIISLALGQNYRDRVYTLFYPDSTRRFFFSLLSAVISKKEFVVGVQKKKKPQHIVSQRESARFCVDKEQHSAVGAIAMPNESERERKKKRMKNHKTTVGVAHTRRRAIEVECTELRPKTRVSSLLLLCVGLSCAKLQKKNLRQCESDFVFRR